MKISKSIPFLVSGFSFLVSAFIFPVQAENKVQNRLENRQEIRQEVKTNNQEMREENRDNRIENRRQNALNIANNLVSKLEKRFDYLNIIKARLQAKIDTLKTKRDMTEAQKKLNLYSTTQYTTDLSALKAKVATISTTDSPKTVVPELKEATRLVQKDLKDLHQYLVDTLKVIVKSPKLTPTASL